MPLQAISAKNVRLNLAKIWKAVESGVTFQVIHRSRPICRIVPEKQMPEPPPAESSSSQQASQQPKKPNSLDLWINIPEHLRFKSKKSAVEIVRELRDE